MDSSTDHPPPWGPPPHPLKPGNSVAIISVAANALASLEGWARIISPFGEEPHFYLVQFESEALPQVRMVLPEWQHDPAQAIHDLNTGRRATPDATLPRAVQLALLPPRINKFAARKMGEQR